jgi:hypothetical protein
MAPGGLKMASNLSLAAQNSTTKSSEFVYEPDLDQIPWTCCLNNTVNGKCVEYI